MKIPFTKMHGLGNNYIYVNLFDFSLKEEYLASIAQDVSNVNTGIGSDGMILITPSEVAHVGMRIFNKDGSEGKNCGNGLRCVAKYAFENNLVSDKKFSIETKAGVVQAEVHGTREHVAEVTVDMGNPILERQAIPMCGIAQEKVVNELFAVEGTTLQVTAVSMGNPHAVFFVDEIGKAPLHQLGPVITNDQRFPEGVNVEFVEVASPTELHFRVWERGSGITQACGTGACASVVASTLNGYSQQGEEVCVHLSGGDLFIRWAKDGHVWMRGAAETIAHGEYEWKPNN